MPLDCGEAMGTWGKRANSTQKDPGQEVDSNPLWDATVLTTVLP